MQVKVTTDVFKGTLVNGGTSFYAKEGEIIDVTNAEWEVIKSNFSSWFTPVQSIIEEVKAIEVSPENKMISTTSKRKRINGVDRSRV